MAEVDGAQANYEGNAEDAPPVNSSGAELDPNAPADGKANGVPYVYHEGQVKEVDPPDATRETLDGEVRGGVLTADQARARALESGIADYVAPGEGGRPLDG